MAKKKDLTPKNDLAAIENRIFVFRNKQVMFDRDLAELYGVETKVLNQAVKRNAERFPEDFCFQLNEFEYNSLRSQIVTLDNDDSLRSQFATLDNDTSLRSQFVTLKNDTFLRSQIVTSKIETHGGRGQHSKYLPYAFTEQGVAMLSAVLRSERAVTVSIRIMNAFVTMRKFLATNAQVFQRLDSLEQHQIESDKKIDELFTKMEQYNEDPRQGIFFQGQIFDSYTFVEKLIQKAKKEIVLIDGYIDLTVLERLAKKKKNVQVFIYTSKNTKITALDVQKFNAQYPTLNLNFTEKMHDRFLIIDNTQLYHIGASIKDLGKKCFAFEKMEDAAIHIANIMNNL